MESSLAVLHKIADAKQLAEGLARVQPNQAPWSTLFTLLEAYEGKVRDHWPLTPEEKEAFRLGWFSYQEHRGSLPAASFSAQRSRVHPSAWRRIATLKPLIHLEGPMSAGAYRGPSQ